MKICIKIFLGIAILAVILFVWARYIEPNLLIIKKINIKNEANSSKMRIVLFSDTHFGKYYDIKNVEKIVNNINNQNPDVVIFSGDLLDNFARDSDIIDINYLSSELKKIDAKFAKFAVWGNHDYGGDAVKVYKELMENAGFKILKNNEINIEDLKLKVYGLDSSMSGNPDLLFQPDKNLDFFDIFISHEGDIVDDIKYKNFDLFLAGHTHGGQVYIPFVVDKVLPPYGKKYRKGEYDIDLNQTKSKIFVTSGIGLTQIPFRFLNVPEICVLDIQ